MEQLHPNYCKFVLNRSTFKYSPEPWIRYLILTACRLSNRSNILVTLEGKSGLQKIITPR